MGDNPEQLLNKRKKPLGRGTTNARRKEKRKNKQWENLSKAELGDPDTVESFEALEKALKKAHEKALAKKAALAERDALEKAADAAPEVTQPEASTASSSKAPRKAPPVHCGSGKA